MTGIRGACSSLSSPLKYLKERTHHGKGIMVFRHLFIIRVNACSSILMTNSNSLLAFPVTSSITVTLGGPDVFLCFSVNELQVVTI